MKPFIQVVEEGGKWYGLVVIRGTPIVSVTANTQLDAQAMVIARLAERLDAVYETLLAIKPVGL